MEITYDNHKQFTGYTTPPIACGQTETEEKRVVRIQEQKKKEKDPSTIEKNLSNTDGIVPGRLHFATSVLCLFQKRFEGDRRLGIVVELDAILGRFMRCQDKHLQRTEER
jgi:hypothetical protein